MSRRVLRLTVLAAVLAVPLPWLGSPLVADVGDGVEDAPAIRDEAKGADPDAALCLLDGPLLCLDGGRFRFRVEWRDFQGAEGEALSKRLTPSSGFFWFFDAERPEVVVKVIDGRLVNGYSWVFFGSMTNVEFTVKVADVFSGEHRVYENPLGLFASTGDILAFPGGLCRDLGGIPCPAGGTCDFSAGQCHQPNPVGMCVPRPDACAETYEPVCACDGTTYPNDCERLAAGAQFDHEGECGGSEAAAAARD